MNIPHVRSLCSLIPSSIRTVLFAMLVLIASMNHAAAEVEVDIPIVATSVDQAMTAMIATRAAQDETAAISQEEMIAKLDPQIGPWYCIGPFKEGIFSNVFAAFNKPYPPEVEVLDAGRESADLSATYEVPRLPGMLDGTRRWEKHEEWSDGWRHLLPRGPAPSRSEIVYIYRTIEVAEDCSLDMKIYAEDYIRVWRNGEQLGEVHRRGGPSRFPSALSLSLPLKKGKNQLLVKIGSIHAAHGFAFSIPLLHPNQSLTPGAWSPRFHRAAGSSNFSPIDRPFQSAFDAKYEPTIPAEPKAASKMIAAQIGIDVETVERLTSGIEATDLAPLARRASDYARAVERLERFKIDLAMIPMFDPEDSEMYRRLDEQVAASEGGAAWTAARDGLRPVIDGALKSAKDGKPSAESLVLAATEAIDRTWRDRAVELPPILFIKRKSYSINAIGPYSIRGPMGASICRFDPAHPDQPAETIFHDPNMAIYDMSLSWDAKTIFFSAHTGSGGLWQLYEIGVDGTGLKRITENDSADYVSPVELPNGDICFVSTQANTWVQCQGRKAGLLYVCNRDGTNHRRISANIDSDHYPQVMDDGRIMFTRWDYGIEKNVFARHALWTVNPDGTGFRLLFGNTIEDPAGFWKARQVPGRPEIVCAFGPHHTNQAGMLGVLWNRLGPEAPRGRGFRFVTDEIPSYCDIKCQYGYTDPLPLNERLFLVSYGGDGGPKNRIYLIDDHGNKKCLYEPEGDLSAFMPLPLQPRKRPPVVVPQCRADEWKYRDPVEMNLVRPDDTWGTLIVHDVYQGVMPHIERGEAKFIQVVEQVQKSQCMAGGEAWGHTPIISRGTVHVRRVIGCVPIEEDGSAHFRVPALRSISLNLLDEEGKTIMRMGSDMHVMPEETQSCIGCHENREGGVAPLEAPRLTTAMRRGPDMPDQEDWGTAGMLDYQRVVQPVWDRHCVKCHSGATPDASLSLTGDRTRFFCMSYDNLLDRGFVDFLSVFALDHDETTPKSVGAVISKILPYLDKKHCGSELSWDERYRVYSWIDANVPYYGTYTYTRVRGIGARDSWETNKGTNRSGWMIGQVCRTFDKRCMGCHQGTVHNQALYGTSSATVSSKHWTVRGVTAHVFPGRYPISAKYGPEFRINLTKPADSLMIQAPLAKSAGGLGLCQHEDGSAVFESKEDSDYQRMLTAIRVGQWQLYQSPRVDMSAEHVAATVENLESMDAEIAEMLNESMKLSEGLVRLPAPPLGKKNLALGAAASSEDGVAIDGGAPRVTIGGAFDGNTNTIWDDKDNASRYHIAAKLTQTQTIDMISIVGWGHHDFSPCDFAIIADGKKIGEVVDAAYSNNRLTIRFPAVECRVLELEITASYGGSPAMRELELYGPRK